MNETYIEFVVLDYNSEDGLEEWMKENLSDYIEKGIVSYFKTNEPKYFNRAHSRNIAFRLAKGNILCNVDADNFIGTGFANYIKKEFREAQNIYLSTVSSNEKKADNNTLGRICLLKEDFYLIEGFDEEMINYGFEDLDFINRLETAGRKKKVICNPEFMNAITHDVTYRISEEFPYKNLETLLVNYINASMSGLLFLFKDNSFAKGIIVNNNTVNSHNIAYTFQKEKQEYEYSIYEEKWIRGQYRKTETDIILSAENNPLFSLVSDNNGCVYSLQENEKTTVYYSITNRDMINEGIFFYSQLSNRMKMEWNKKNSILKTNAGNYGRGTVYKNFDYDNPISL